MCVVCDVMCQSLIERHSRNDVVPADADIAELAYSTDAHTLSLRYHTDLTRIVFATRQFLKLVQGDGGDDDVEWNTRHHHALHVTHSFHSSKQAVTRNSLFFCGEFFFSRPFCGIDRGENSTSQIFFTFLYFHAESASVPYNLSISFFFCLIFSQFLTTNCFLGTGNHHFCPFSFFPFFSLSPPRSSP